MSAVDDETKPSEASNILDQLQARALPFYGGGVARAPHMERLAWEGVVFDQAYCNSPLCAPSRASMLTGLMPSQTGAYDRPKPTS